MKYPPARGPRASARARSALPALARALAVGAAVTIASTIATAISVAIPGPAWAAPHRDTTAPPDIVMLMLDDLDLSVWQSALDRGLLPRMQADLIDHGTTFDNMFLAESTCCPSRTSYLTGQYPHNHGVLRTEPGPHGGFQSFANDGNTVATWLHAAGYRTGLMGKYLNGYGHSPKDQGGTYVPPGWDAWWALATVVQYDYWVSIDGVPTYHGHTAADYQTDALSVQAQAFLRVDDPRPFFLTLTPTAPHYESTSEDDSVGGSVRSPRRYLATPVLATIPPEALASYNEADMSDKPAYMRNLPPQDVAGQRHGYNDKVSAIRAVDDLLGAVVDTLKANGRWDHTLLILTSDNGFQYGTHRRIQKIDLYEESIRVPMVIHAPGQVAPRHVGTWAMNVDWAPTIADAAAATPTIVVDGQSLMPWVRGGAGTDRLALLVEYPPTGNVVVNQPPFSMVRTHDPAITGDPSGQAVLVYAEFPDKAGMVTDREFYDLSLDPLQLQSLDKSVAPIRQRQMTLLSRQLGQARRCRGEQCRVY
jgi:arylsulfatase A-like enzyme